MLPQYIKAPADELRKRLPSHGWQLVETEQPYEDEWWAAEFWHLQSTWSPRSVRVYLAFLVDPMVDRLRVWAVRASSERPDQQPVNERPLLRFGHRWRDELPSFLDSLAHFRAG
jgi:hypothetical protein